MNWLRDDPLTATLAYVAILLATALGAVLIHSAIR